MDVNKTGGVVWELCAGELSADEIIELLTEAFPESAADIENDVLETLARLSDNDAIEIVA